MMVGSSDGVSQMDSVPSCDEDPIKVVSWLVMGLDQLDGGRKYSCLMALNNSGQQLLEAFATAVVLSWVALGALQAPRR